MNRNTFVVFIYLLLAAFTAGAKGTSGIYLTAADFKAGKLTYQSDCTAATHNIRLHDFFRQRATMTVKADGKLYTLKKSAVFGYKDCNNELYRLYKNAPYRIREAGHIIIYSKQRNVAQSKGFHIVTDYFFSVAADSELMPLSISRLRYAYGDNYPFLELLETASITGEPYDYDQQHKTFKVNYIFSKTITHDK